MSRSSSIRLANPIHPADPSVRDDPPLNQKGLVVLAVTACKATSKACDVLLSQQTKQQATRHYVLAVLQISLLHAEYRLEQQPPVLESSVLRLLTVLERLVNWPKPFNQPRGPHRRKQFSRLDELIAGKSVSARYCIKRFATSRAPSIDKPRRDIETYLIDFARKNPVAGPGDPGVLAQSVSATTVEELTPWLRNLYTVLRNVSRCAESKVDSDFTANILLNSISHDEGNQDSFKVDMAFIHHHHTNYGGPGSWKQARIHMKKHWQMTNYTWVAATKGTTCLQSCSYLKHRQQQETSDSTSEINISSSPSKIDEFCTAVRSNAVERLVLSVLDGDLLQHVSEPIPRERRIPLAAKSVSLAGLLNSGCFENDQQQHKLLLSCILAKAVWQFYESDWMSQPLTKRNVWFMQQYAGVTYARVKQPRPEKTHECMFDPRPYISARLAAAFNHRSSNGAHVTERPQGHRVTLMHEYPTILALGILLLEIELGCDLPHETLDTQFDPDYRLRPNADFQAALDVLESDTWKEDSFVRIEIRQAIDFCIIPQRFKIGMGPGVVREELLKRVVQPLENLFINTFHDQIEKYSPGSLMLKTLPHEPDDPHIAPEPRTASIPLQLPEVTELCFEPAVDCTPGTGHLDLDSWELFGDQNECLYEASNANAADEWVKTFKQYLYGSKIGQIKSERLRVAIIDTGIDMDNPEIKRFEEHVKEFESFVPGQKATIDESGHGTHIAGTILSLTRNVDLYIAKLCSKRVMDQSEKGVIRERLVKVPRPQTGVSALSPDFVANRPDQNLQALSYCREQWRVHMVSLSFGYHKRTEPDYVWEELDKCIKADIVVFASASNDAGNRPRTFPGRYEDVLCAHSATGLGNASRFNPSAIQGKNNFSFVGEALDPYYPVDGRDDRSADTKQRFTGTSYATPVAVAIAAYMVGYIRRTMKDDYFPINPMSPRGIRRLFDGMSQRRVDYDWIDLNHFFFDNPDVKEKLKALLGHD